MLWIIKVVESIQNRTSSLKRPKNKSLASLIDNKT